VTVEQGGGDDSTSAGSGRPARSKSIVGCPSTRGIGAARTPGLGPSGRARSARRPTPGLGGLTSIGGHLIITGNTALRNLDGLDGLTSVGGDLSIGALLPGPYGAIGNDVLENIDALSGLTTIGGNHTIVRNAALTDLAGLRALRSVSGSVAVWGDDALTSVDGLAGLTSIGGNLVVGTEFIPWNSGPIPYGNAALTNLAGLGAVTDLGGGFTAMHNTVLPTCEATTLADRLVSLGWDGTATIEGNDDAGVCE
jgi:hypothetical protein